MGEVAPLWCKRCQSGGRVLSFDVLWGGGAMGCIAENLPDCKAALVLVMSR